MGKKRDIQYRKTVIEALRNRPMRYGELVKLKIDEKTIPEKTVERILGELKDYGLVIKGEKGRLDYWYWCDQIRTRKSFTSKSEFEQYIGHCRILIPSFEKLIIVQFLSKDEIEFDMTYDKDYRLLSPEVLRYMKFAEEHLKTGYPRTFGKLEEFQMVIQNLRETEKNLEGMAQEKLFIELKECTPRPRWREQDSSAYARKNYWKIRSEELARRMASALSAEARMVVMGTREKPKDAPTDEMLDLRDHLLELSLDQSLITKVRESMKNEFENLKKTWGSIKDMVDDLAGEVELIIMRIEMGDPLQGKCELCPQVDIKDQEK